MDIRTALDGSTPANRSGGRCKLQKTLDAIPDDTTGKPDLVAAAEDLSGTWAGIRLASVFANLGTPVSASGITLHRRHLCACYGIRG